jgi:hypothetical protein
MLDLRYSLLLFLVGCGGKTIDPLQDGGSNDGSPQKDAVVIDVSPPPPPPTDGAPPPQCNSIDPGTKTITVAEVPQNPPPFGSTGNQIQPGLYELVSITVYTGPNGTSGSGGSIAGEVRVNIANSADYIFQVATVQDNQGVMRSNSSGNSSGPGVLVITQTCPTPDQGTKVLYTADSSSLALRVGTGNTTADEKFAYIGP